MEQFDQLLTCCICLDRFRNPKLLPCQHSFCMEPCMEGLINYVTRQLKCPECRAEHRVPYQGIQAYPTNVTLQRFLDLHMDITGELPDPTAGQIMERCSVCTEKNYCSICTHCDKKICSDCKNAHLDILKREIGRINNQIRRCAHRLPDSVGLVEKNMIHLQTNCSSVMEEIDEVYRRLSKALKDRVDYLKSEVEIFLAKEMKNLSSLKENLEQEVSNIDSNCDLAEKHMTDTVEWDDNELMDAKDIFLRTMEFIRNFDYEPGDYNRRVRFNMSHDANQLAGTLSCVGELTINVPAPFNASGPPQPPSLGPGLMRSKSDHRVAAQFRQAEERYNSQYGEDRALSPRRQFGDRSSRSRYGQTNDDDDYGSGGDSRRTRFRSRFMRHLDSVDSDNEASVRNVRFSEGEEKPKKEREKVIDTESVAKGPLSGVIRLFDSPRVMKRLQDVEFKEKHKNDPPKPGPPPPAPIQPFQLPKRAARQPSEEDEISKQKKQNKEAAAGTSDSKPPLSSVAESAKRKTSGQATAEEEMPRRSQPSTPTTEKPKPAFRQTSASERREEPPTVAAPASSSASTADSDENSTVATRAAQRAAIRAQNEEPPRQRHSYAGSTTTGALPSSTAARPISRASSSSSVNLEPEPKSGRSSRIGRVSIDRFKTRSGSSDSATSESSSRSSPVRNTGAAFSTDELKNRFSGGAAGSRSGVSNTPAVSRNGNTSDNDSGSTRSRYGNRSPQTTTTTTSSVPSPRPGSTTSTGVSSSTQRAPFQSRFLGQAGTPTAEISKESESSSSGESSDSGSESEDEAPATKASTTPATVTVAKKEPGKEPTRTDFGSLLARSAQARDTSSSLSTPKSETATSSPYSRSRTSALTPSTTQSQSTFDTPSTRTTSRYGTDSTASRYGGSSETAPSSRYGTESASRYGSGADTTTGSALARSRTGYRSRERPSSSNPDQSSSLYTGRDTSDTTDRYPLTSKYLNRSRANLDDDSSSTASSRYGSSGYRSRFLNRSRSSAALAQDEEGGDEEIKSPEVTVTSPPSIPGDERYPSGRSRYAALKERRSRLARSKSSAEVGGDDVDDALDTVTSSVSNAKSREPSPETQKEGEGSHLSNWARYLKSKYGTRLNQEAESDPNKRLRKSNTSGGVSRASSPESDGETQLPSIPFSGPRHQYMQKRKIILKVGQRGAEPGHFTWPRGVAVGPDGSIVIADSSNHRVQIFDNAGSFLKEFGHYGNGEGEFDCLAGVAVNRIGQFIIADRYNHRIQVFDPQGRFLRAFGSQGSSDGKFSYPWGITTDALGFIYVCDKENHRIQVFQSDGTFVGKFGSLGSKPGQLEHPHYIAVSNTNRVIVSDSNNHRIQIFDVNGKVLSAFGLEGSDDGQFKFPRGIAVDEQGYIVVGDSGNNRIQIFTSDGTFLRAFGTWGSSDGEFKGLEGIAVTSSGNILVCDRENHRIQMF